MRTQEKLWRFARLSVHRASLLLGGHPRVPFPVLANSVPKAGSHLLARCLELMGLVYNRTHVHYLHPDERIEQAIRGTWLGEFLTAHIPYSTRWHNLLAERRGRVLLIIRDPRDVVVSHFYYVTYKDRKHRLRPYYLQLADDHARLMASIQGLTPSDGNPYGRLDNIARRFRSFLEWEHHDALVVRFEHLVGPEGGGSAERQEATIRNIAHHLGLPLSPEKVRFVAHNLFYRKSATFRKGSIGDWRNHFTEEHKRVFKELAGDLLIDLGYERDNDW